MARGKAERVVHVRKGQTAIVKLRAGVEIEVEHLSSGAVRLRNASTRATLRVWAPKETG